MNNLDKARVAMNKEKLRAIVITIVGTDEEMSSLDAVGVEDIKKDFIPGSLKVDSNGVRVDFIYYSPIKNTTSGGPQVYSPGGGGGSSNVGAALGGRTVQGPTSPLSPTPLGKSLNQNSNYT